MKSVTLGATAIACLALCACVGEHDRFYVLNALPDDAAAGFVAAPIHVLLAVTLPSLVDRAEMVINTSDDQILLMEHERWAAPLSDQMAQTLARDIERRRPDVVVVDRNIEQGSEPLTIKIEVVRITARKPGRVSMEVHWRINGVKTGTDQIGVDEFESPVNGDGYQSIARAYSEVLGRLADKVASNLPH